MRPAQPVRVAVLLRALHSHHAALTGSGAAPAALPECACACHACVCLCIHTQCKWIFSLLQVGGVLTLSAVGPGRPLAAHLLLSPAAPDIFQSGEWKNIIYRIICPERKEQHKAGSNLSSMQNHRQRPPPPRPPRPDTHSVCASGAFLLRTLGAGAGQ